MLLSESLIMERLTKSDDLVDIGVPKFINQGACLSEPYRFLVMEYIEYGLEEYLSNDAL